MNNPRVAEAAIDPMFLERWSPRSFQARSVPEDVIASLFEAARWAPSCFNEQPWLFLWATSEKARELFCSLLVESNQVWACRAPMLAFVFTRRNFAKNNKPNRWAGFDAGAAWMSLTLEARKRDLYTHGMAGFDEAKTYEALGISRDDYEAIAAVAIGYRDEPEKLPEALAAKEFPNERKPAAEVAKEWKG